MKINKANLRDLIAVTNLVILLKLDSNHWFFSPYDLETWWMTSKIKRAPRLGYINLCVLFQSHQWIQTGVTILWRAHSWEIWITGEPKASVQDNINQTTDNGYTIEEKHRSSEQVIIMFKLPDEVITFKKITLKSKAGLVLINYSHAILDQEIQNNGGCPEAAGPDRERFLQPRKYQKYPHRSWLGNWLWASRVKIRSDSTENKLNPIQFLIYYNVQFASNHSVIY